MPEPTYAEKLKDPRWIALRSRVLERDGFRCRCCQSPENLQIHHTRYQGEPWEVEPKYLITLCESCHEKRTVIERQIRDIFPYLSLETLKQVYQVMEGIAMKCPECDKTIHSHIREWPLLNVGDEMFFGYVSGIGFDQEDTEVFSRYVSFTYGCESTRYKLPNDEDLLRKLSKHLRGNFWGIVTGNGIYDKVWIKLTKDGYTVDLP